MFSWQEKTAKMDKMVKTTLLFFFFQIYDNHPNNTNFFNISLIFSMTHINIFLYYTGRDGRDGLNGNVFLSHSTSLYIVRVLY